MDTSRKNTAMVELHFILNVVDEWPPVSIEGILCTQVAKGYRLESPPLFVKGLSVGDVISADFEPTGNVASWHVLARSRRTTVWILRTGPGDNIAAVLRELQAIGCKVVELPKLGCCAVDVPAEISIADVDALLAHLAASSTAVVFPSFRHDQEATPD